MTSFNEDAYHHQLEMDAHMALREALRVSEPDLDLIRRLAGPGGCAMVASVPCLLSHMCIHPYQRTPAMVAALLDGGFPADGLERHGEDAPLAEVLAHPGEHDTTTVALLLRHGANVHLSTQVDSDDPGYDSSTPVWVQMLRTLRQDYLALFLASGWQPESWRTWPVGQNEERLDPLRALMEGVIYGPFRGQKALDGLSTCEARAIEMLNVLVQHGFQAQAHDLDRTTMESLWYRQWLQQHEENLLKADVPTPTQIAPHRPRL